MSEGVMEQRIGEAFAEFENIYLRDATELMRGRVSRLRDEVIRRASNELATRVREAELKGFEQACDWLHENQPPAGSEAAAPSIERWLRAELAGRRRRAPKGQPQRQPPQPWPRQDGA